MRRLEGRGLSLGTVKERNAPESVTPIRARRATATCSVDSHGPALDQVGLRCRTAGTSVHLLIAGVESEVSESQVGFQKGRSIPHLILHSSCPGYVPGIHVLPVPKQERRGWPGRSPAMTKVWFIAFWRRAAGSPGSRTGWLRGRPCRAGSGSSSGTAPGYACRRSARTRLRCCAGRRGI
jgi:hypothetical protein